MTMTKVWPVLLVTIVWWCKVARCETHVDDVHKVVLTQRGYIQFLKYKVEVPPLQQYTFCLWMRSDNLTYSHPLLSYSKRERDRFIRCRVTEGGYSLRLSLMEQDVADVYVGLETDVWYHICQSWDSNTGRWQMYLNGLLVGQGVGKATRGLVIPGGGDVVVGQEYTDFDKGLDDGIEGEVFGFNMILSSTTEEPNHRYYHNRDNPPRPNRYGDAAAAKSSIYEDYVRLSSIVGDAYATQKPTTTTTTTTTMTTMTTTTEYSRFDVDNLRFVNNHHKNDPKNATFPDATFSSSDGDTDYDLFSPPVRSLNIPFWNYINTAGREGRFRTEVVQPLALNALPVYETPPHLPVYEEDTEQTPRDTPPSYEVLYSHANYKGYDQNDYFPKELLRRRPKNGGGSRHRHRGHHHNHHHHSHHPKKPKKEKDLYPYPSEFEPHTIHKRDARREKNVEILNPDSILIYPSGSGALNVEVFPRAGDPDDDEDDENEERPTYEVAYAKMHYTGGSSPTQLRHPQSITEKNERFGANEADKAIYLLDFGKSEQRRPPARLANEKTPRRGPKSAGRKLVELSYRKCLLDRGSLLGEDPASLVAWTRTPVRVFGGAALKRAAAICGAF